MAAWISTKKCKMNVGTAKQVRNARICKALLTVARHLHKKDLSTWVANCGRGVSRTMGPVIYLRKLGAVIKMNKKEMSRRPGGLDLTKAGATGQHRLASSEAELKFLRDQVAIT